MRAKLISVTLSALMLLSACTAKAETEPSVHELLSVTNYLVDGRYVDALRDLNLHFRGSSNQRIFDVTCYPNAKDAQIIEL